MLYPTLPLNDVQVQGALARGSKGYDILAVSISLFSAQQPSPDCLITQALLLDLNKPTLRSQALRSVFLPTLSDICNVFAEALQSAVSLLEGCVGGSKGEGLEGKAMLGVRSGGVFIVPSDATAICPPTRAIAALNEAFAVAARDSPESKQEEQKETALPGIPASFAGELGQRIIAIAAAAGTLNAAEGPSDGNDLWAVAKRLLLCISMQMVGDICSSPTLWRLNEGAAAVQLREHLAMAKGFRRHLFVVKDWDGMAMIIEKTTASGDSYQAISIGPDASHAKGLRILHRRDTTAYFVLSKWHSLGNLIQLSASELTAELQDEALMLLKDDFDTASPDSFVPMIKGLRVLLPHAVSQSAAQDEDTPALDAALLSAMKQAYGELVSEEKLFILPQLLKALLAPAALQQ